MASLHQTSTVETPDIGVPATEFGASLREIRLAHQRKLSDVSDDLRIRQVFLRAIEAGNFDELPGPAYAVGFVRAYADYLGLDVEEVVRTFKELGGGFNRQTSLVPPSPVAEGKLPTGSVLLVAGMLAATAYGGWLYVSADGKDAGDVVAGLSQRIAALVGMSAEPELPASPSTPAAVAAAEPPAAVVQENPVATDIAARVESTAGDEAAAEAAVPAEPSAAESAGADTAPGQGDTSSEQVETAPAAGAADSAAASETAAPETAATEPPAPPSTTAIEIPAAPAPGPPPAPPPTDSQPEPAPTAAAPGPTPARPPVSDAPSPVSGAMTQTPAEPAAAAAMPPQPEAATEAASAAPAAGAESPAEPVSAAVAASSAATPPEARPETQASAPVTQQEPPSNSAPSPPAATPALQQTAAVPATPSRQMRVTVRATANTWVEVLRGDKQMVFSRMMQSGEAVDLPVLPGMTLSTGNAGGLVLMIDGEALPPLGPHGAIRRNVALDAKSLLKKTGRAQ